MGLMHLIYVSNSPAPLDAAELDRILESAVRHNTPQQVTGMLLYVNGSFMQVLEGEEAAVKETYGRIAKDPRHTNIFILEQGPIAARSFDRWSMGFRRLGQAEADQHPNYAPFFQQGFDATRIGAKPGLALEMLKDFGLMQR